MKLMLMCMLVIGCKTVTQAEQCSNPFISNKKAFIYRSDPTIKVKVLSCFYNDGSDQKNYYDISPNCLEAFKTGTFVDKFNEIHYIKSNSTQVILDEYITEADPMRNTINLRSGTKCRYDAGFCYDPKESLSYAVTWNVLKRPQQRCSDDMVQVFHGYVDFWKFEPENREYLLYTTPSSSESFALSLSNSSFCRNKQVWYNDEYGYVVSLVALESTDTAVPLLVQKLLPSLKPKAVVIDGILENCNLKGHSKIDDYLKKLENLDIILKKYQQDNNIKNSFPSDLDNLKNLTDHNVKHIQNLFDEIKHLVSIDKEIYLNISNIFSDINKINSLVKNNDTKSLQLKQIFGKFNKNMKNLVKKEINSLRPRIVSSILSKIKLINSKSVTEEGLSRTILETSEPIIKVQECLKEGKLLKKYLKNTINSFNLKFKSNEREIKTIYQTLNRLSTENDFDQINPLLLPINNKISDNSNVREAELVDSSSKINTFNSKLNDLENKLTDLQKKQIQNEINMNVVTKNITSIYSHIEEAAYNTKVDTLQQVLRKLNPSAIDENIVREFEKVKQFLTEKVSASEEKIKNIEQKINDWEKSIKEDSQPHEITQDPNKVNENIRDLPRTTEDAIMKKIMPTFFLAFDKNYKCERELNQLQYEFENFKDTITSTIERILKEHKRYDHNFLRLFDKM